MEVFLRLWDGLDDVMYACRHVATAVAIEALAGAVPIATAAAALWIYCSGWPRVLKIPR